LQGQSIDRSHFAWLQAVFLKPSKPEADWFFGILRETHDSAASVSRRGLQENIPIGHRVTLAIKPNLHYWHWTWFELSPPSEMFTSQGIQNTGHGIIELFSAGLVSAPATASSWHVCQWESGIGSEV
jgi:hypothetical protein